MPVEIKELTIKAVISPPNVAPDTSSTTLTGSEWERIKREIKRECFEELKQFLNDQKER